MYHRLDPRSLLFESFRGVVEPASKDYPYVVEAVR